MIPRENQQRGRAWIFPILALLLSSGSALAGTTGNLTGYVTGPNNAPLPGVKVTVTSPVLQGSRSVTTDAQGFFRLTQLPPGDGYRARFEVSGFKTTERTGIVINIDSTIKLPTIRMSAVQTQEAIEVVEEAPLVEQGNTTIGRTLSNEFLSAVPTGRTTTQVLALAPGASSDQQGVTFRGATSPENHYVVDGLNTTGIVAGLASSSLPPEFIQEIQIKTGGYEPEYGRATGGQAIIITKSGGNEFHGDVFAYVTPVYGPSNTVVTDGRNSLHLRNANNQLTAQLGFDLGGYIVKDRLWFFVGYAPSFNRQRIGHEFRTYDDVVEGQEDPEAYMQNPELTENAVYDKYDRIDHFYLANLTFNINENHSLRLSASGNPVFANGYVTVTYGDPATYMATQRGGAQDYNITYNGKFLGGMMNLDAIVGYHTENGYTLPYQGTYNSLSGNSPFDGTEIDGSVVRVTHNQTNYEVPGTDCGDGAPCQFYGYRTGGLGSAIRTSADRFVVKPVLSIFLNNFIGNHVIKLGGDFERNHLLNRRAYTGGALVTEVATRYQVRYYSDFGEDVLWQGLDNNESYFNAETWTLNSSAFLQDSWSILSNLSLSLGIRWERQQIQDVFGVSRIDIKDNIAPRLGLIFDFTNQGKSKLFANFGRYYEAIPQDINDRALSAEGFNFYLYNKKDAQGNDLYPTADTLPIDNPSGTLQAALGGELTPVQEGLKGQYSDQFIAGFEYEVMDNISAGITGIYAKLGNVIEDISPDDGTTYYISNPGSDNYHYLVAPSDPESGYSTSDPSEYVGTDTNGDGVISEDEAQTFRSCFASTDPLTGAPVTYCFPTPTRTYRAAEVTFTKRFSNNWQAQASYTWSQTFGNYPGLFSETNGQLDPNITSQFDLPSLLVNRVGFVDQDRQHNIKFAGAYQFNFGTSLGLTANIQSGTPVNWLGAHPVYGESEAFVLPRSLYPEDEEANAAFFAELYDDEIEPVSRRTPWLVQLDANARHFFKFANKQSLMVGVQVNNVLNAHTALRQDQDWTYDYGAPAVGGTRLSQVQCYDDGTGAPQLYCERNSNFGNAVAYQAPFNVRFEVKYSF